MKTYSLIGHNIGIEIEAENAVEAIEKAEQILLQGLGGCIEFTKEEDQEEYEKVDF